jgi:hypothetical protein
MRRVGLAAWMNAPEPPFWTTREGHALLVGREPFRQTELDVRAPGIQPKSVFQLVGAGQVGRGSLYGMQALHRLAEAGFHVWPFAEAAFPLVVEIFPRLLTGPVVKSSSPARTAYLARRGITHELAATTEDAFDAAVSALVMAREATGFAGLPAQPHDYRREGRIWAPPYVAADSAVAMANPNAVASPAVRPAPRAASGIIESTSITRSAPAANPLIEALSSPEAPSAIA